MMAAVGLVGYTLASRELGGIFFSNLQLQERVESRFSSSKQG